MKLYHFENLQKHNILKHAVTMRDEGEKLDFSLAYHTGQEQNVISENRDKMAEFFGEGFKFVSPLQIHSDSIHVVASGFEHGWREFDDTLQVDALVTDELDVVLTILSADCVPVLLFDPVQMAIGAVHAGWQGSAHEIVTKTVQKMKCLYGSKPNDMVAGIGPAIGGCCYEVGKDVANHFVQYPDALEQIGDDKYLLDLKMVNSMQLQEVGVKPANIEVSSYCTSCDNDLFFSYRKEGGTPNRFMSAIAMLS